MIDRDGIEPGVGVVVRVGEDVVVGAGVEVVAGTEVGAAVCVGIGVDKRVRGGVRLIVDEGAVGLSECVRPGADEWTGVGVNVVGALAHPIARAAIMI